MTTTTLETPDLQAVEPRESGPLSDLFDLVGGRWPLEEQGSAQRMQMALRAGAASLALLAVYGAVIGSTDLSLALGNAWKLPGVLALSTLTALPAALLTHRLTGGHRGASNLVAATMAGNFTAALVLAALSPLVALYYHTSASLGAPLAMASGVLALVVGCASGIRLVRRSESLRRALTVPTVVLITIQLLAMAQLLFLASPILPEANVFEAGIEGMFE